MGQFRPPLVIEYLSSANWLGHRLTMPLFADLHLPCPDVDFREGNDGSYVTSGVD
jgi:hypothetical protein